MWFKRVLLGYCAASLAVTIVTAAFSKDATVPKRHHQIERLTFPSLQRRQQPVGNQTSLTEIIVPTSKDATSSSIFKSSETSQISTSVATPTTVSLPQSISSSSPFPTPSESGLDFSSVTPSSSNVDASSTSLRSTESTTPFSSAPEQQPSETSATVLSSLSQDANSEHAISSTVLDITSVMSSSTEKSWVSSSMETATSSILEPTPISTTASGISPSSMLTPSPQLTSASEPVGRTSQAQSNTVPTLASNSVTSLTSIESGTSTVPVPTSQTLVPEASTEVVSTLALTSQLSSTTSIKQQPSSFIISSPEGISIAISTPAISVTPSSAQAPISSSTTVSPVMEGQTSSSGAAETSSSAAPRLTTIAAPSSAELSFSIETPTPSEAASSILVSSAFEPGPTSALESATSTVEETQSAPSSSFLATSAVSISSTEQPLSRSLAESTSTAGHMPSSIMDQPSRVTPSSPTIIPASSTQIEQGPTVSEMPSLSSSTVSSQSPPVSSDLTTGAPSSFSLAPTSFSSLLTTQPLQLLSETDMFTSLLVEVISIVSVSLAPTLSTSVLAPSPTFVETGASVSTSSEIATTGFGSATILPSASLGTSALSSVTAGSELASSFLPSETLVISAFSFVVSSAKTSSDVSQASSFAATLSGTQPGSPGPSSTTSTQEQSPSGVITASESENTNSQTSSVLNHDLTSSLPLSASSASSPSLSSLSSVSQALSSQHPTSIAAPPMTTSTNGAIPTSESAGPSLTTTTLSSAHNLFATATFSGISSFASSGALTSISTIDTPLPSSGRSNGTQTISSFPIASGTITATFSTVYVSSARSFSLDLSTVAFSLLSSVTGAAANQTNIRTSSAITATITSQGSVTHIPASESLTSSTKLGSGANSTWTSPLRPSLTTTAGFPGSLNSTRTSTAEFGFTFSHSALPTGTTPGTAPVFNATQAETLQTSSVPVALNSTTTGLFASTTSDSTSNSQSETQSTMSASSSDEVSTTDGAGTEDTKTSAAPHAPTSSPSQTAAAGSPPPLTTSQTAGVAVGATTGLLIAVVAAIFIARRYHAAKHGKRMSTGSIYPKVAYLYDPKTGGDGGDAEALMSGATGGPGGPVSRAAQGLSNHMQRHSTGTMPATLSTSPGNPFAEAVRGPAVHRYSEYARIDTARALSAAVAGYDGAARHSSSYTKYPSDVTNPFSDHVIPSPTFAPFSPNDIRRPELKTPHNVDDGRGEYSQMSVNPYAYLNTSASMYQPVSPYGRPSTQGPSSAYNTRRQTVDSDPFADPFEHDLLLHVDEQNRTSDSVTIFAPSPNLMSPRTPRTPVGPKLSVRQPNGMASAGSLLSPVAAKYLHKAQEVKIPRKSVASPVLVQVGRSPVIKPFSPPPAAPEPLGWDDIKRNSKKHFSDEQSVPAPLKFASSVIKKKPVPTSHTRMKPSLTGAGQALLAGNGLPLTVKIPHRYSKSVGLDVPRVHGRSGPAHEELSSDPVVREKRSRELRFADPALIGKEF